VQAAFRNFYADTGGIRDAFVATAARVAGEFADEPAVAGYDLPNEPNKVLPDDESTARYTDLVGDLVASIRAAETDAGGFAHLLFLEPLVLFPRRARCRPTGSPTTATSCSPPSSASSAGRIPGPLLGSSPS
jgi:hypothetical protein